MERKIFIGVKKVWWNLKWTKSNYYTTKSSYSKTGIRTFITLDKKWGIGKLIEFRKS